MSKQKKRSKEPVSDEDEVPNSQEEKKGFRFCREDVFLTYAQCPLGYEAILERLRELKPIAKYLASDEKHADGALHSHLYVKFASALDSKNPQVFDVQGYHPNIQKTKKGDLQRLFAYIMKDGKYAGDVGDLLVQRIDGFKKRRADLKAFQQYVAYKGAAEVAWPITLPCGMRYNPATLGKKRHLWIVGRPSMGKTTWLQDTFAGQRVFTRAPTDYHFEGYEGEKVIIYDDIIPKFEELSAVSNVYKIKTRVPGSVRFETIHWPLNQERIMIVLTNNPPQYGALQDAVLSRFVVVDYSERFDVSYPPEPDRDLVDALAADDLVNVRRRSNAFVIESPLE